MKPEKRTKSLMIERSGVSKRTITRDEMRALLNDRVVESSSLPLREMEMPLAKLSVEIPEPVPVEHVAMEVIETPEPQAESETEYEPPAELPAMAPLPAVMAMLTSLDKRRAFGQMVRERLGTTQAYAAQQMGYKGRGVFTNVLNGERPWTEERLHRLLDFLKIEPETLLENAQKVLET